jgi:hypothetical protein
MSALEMAQMAQAYAPQPQDREQKQPGWMRLPPLVGTEYWPSRPQGYAFGGMALMNPMTMVMRNQATQGFAFGGMVNAARMQRAMQMAAQQQAMGGGRYNKMLGALRRVPGMAGYAAPAPQQAPAPMPMNPGEAYAQQPAPMPGMAYGGLVPGFALGGMAGFGGGSSSMYGGMRQRMNNMPPPPAGSPQRLTSGTSSGDAATMTNGRYATTDPNKNSKDYWRDAQGIVRDRNGNVYSYNPDKPWESMTGSYDPGSRGISQRLIGRFGEAGYFDPEGNRALMDSVRAEALSNARATQQGAALRAQLAGMDPGAAASYRMEAGLRGSGDVARALNAARLQSMLQQQQLANAMLREDQGFGYGIYSALNQANLQNRNAAESDKRANSGGFMGGLGQLVGAGVGSMFGPAGTALGTAAGKKLFG